MAVVAAVRRREDGSEYHETGKCERPVAQVLAEAPQRSFLASGQVQDKIAGDGEKSGRKQCQEVGHETPVRSAIDRRILLPPRRRRTAGRLGEPSGDRGFQDALKAAPHSTRV